VSDLNAARKTILSGLADGKKSLFICGLLVTVTMAVFYCYEPTFFRFLDNKIYDTLARSTSADVTSGNPVIVDLDEKTLSRFGQWPWPRYRVALLLEKLKASGASAIALDMVFADTDRTSLKALQKDVLRDLNININFSGVPVGFADNDSALANVLSNGPFVLGYKFTFPIERKSGKKCLLHPINTIIIKKGKAQEKINSLFQAQDVVCNLDIFSGVVRSSGFINAHPDFDGVVRRAPLLMQYDGKVYPSLTLAALNQAFNIKQVTLKMTSRGIESLSLDNKATIPLDAQGNMLIQFHQRSRTFRYISAGDILNGLVPDEEIKGKIVFIGTSAAGLEELCSTPLDPAFPGVEVHATIIDNIMNNKFFSRPYWAPGIELLTLLAVGIVSTLLLNWTGVLWNLLFITLGASGLWQGAHWFLQGGGIFLSPLFPLITMGANYGLLVFIKYWHEEQKARARTKELLAVQDFTILCLTSLTETRDSETGGHILRTQRYIRILCRHLSTKPKFHDSMDADTIERLYKSAPLHDIGKVGVLDQILRKSGKLSLQEFEEIKKHPLYGLEVIQRAEAQCEGRTNASFLGTAKEMVYTHHEKWDGTGYPRGLKGEEIPLSGRIMAIVDSYDALISSRVYKRSALSHEDAVAHISQSRGLNFDPDLVDAFMEIHDKFRATNLEFDFGKTAG
jgi:HD-GYP domain-containing protein (c-di-GMP phosphodiesterase class II)